VRVARALRLLHPAQLNRVTLIAAAPLTDEWVTSGSGSTAGAGDVNCIEGGSSPVEPLSKE
jgi:hypothetical protein